MSAPQQPSRRKNEPVEGVPPQHQLDPVSGPDGDSASSDQDIDTAGTEADDGAAKRPGAPPAGRPTIDRHR